MHRNINKESVNHYNTLLQVLNIEATKEPYRRNTGTKQGSLFLCLVVHGDINPLSLTYVYLLPFTSLRFIEWKANEPIMKET